MPTPLLQYSVSTAPAPLQVSTTGAITIVASNPGGYSDLAAKDYVDVSSIVFDFGVVGSDGSDLTTGAGSTWTVTPPANWGAPSISGLQFTFTPPVGATHISPNTGFAFMFEGFPVNATVGTVSLVITESASTPGDPAQPTVYPSIGPQVANVTKLLGKFPLDFTIGEFAASPSNISAGGATTLSWSDSPGAVYTLLFGSQTITQHGNGDLLASTDSYPNPAKGDPPLDLETTTVFTLDVTYTPPGGAQATTLQRQVTVSVVSPLFSSLNAAPANIEAGGAFTLSWSDINIPPTAVYALSHVNNDGSLYTVIEHGNGDLLKSTDSYPDTSKGDQPLHLFSPMGEQTPVPVVFTLKTTGYSGSGERERQATITVTSPNSGLENWSNSIRIGTAGGPPSLAVLNGSLCCAYADSSGNIWLTATQDGVNWSAAENVYPQIENWTQYNFNPGPTVTTPTLSEFHGVLFCTYLSEINGPPYSPGFSISWQAGAVTWGISGMLYPGTWKCKVVPGSLEYNGALLLFYGNNNTNITIGNYDMANNWDTTPVVSGACTADTPAMALHNGNLIMVYRYNNNIFAGPVSTTFGQWKLQSYSMVQGIVVSTDSVRSTLATLDSNLYCAFMPAANPSPIKLISASGLSELIQSPTSVTIPNATTAGSPSLAAFNRNLYCAYPGTDGNVYVTSTAC